MDDLPASKEPRRRTGGRSARVRDAVVRATLDILDRGQWPTVDEVARQAKVQKTTIYRRWGSVEGFVLESIQSRAEREIAIPDTGALRADLVVYLSAGLAFQRSRFGEMVTRVAVHAPEPARRAYWARRFEAASIMFERARARGELAGPVDDRFAIEMLIAPLYLRTLVTCETLSDDLPERLADFVLSALRAPG